MKKTSRIISLCLAVMFIVSCIALPASAINGWRFTSSVNSAEHPVICTTFDAYGNPVPTLRDLPFDSQTNITLRKGEDLKIWDTDKSGVTGIYFALPTGTSISIDVGLESKGKVQIGYARNDGTPVYEYEATSASTSHSASFTIPDSGNYIFRIHNNSAYSVTITSISIS